MISKNLKEKVLRDLKDHFWLTIPLILFVLIRIVLGFDGLYGQDSYEYLRCARWLTVLIHGYREPTIFFWPVVYPFLGSLFSFVRGYEAWALQIISLFAFTGTLLVTNNIILLIHPAFKNSAKIFMIFLVLPATYFLRAAFFVMSDMSATFFVLTAFYCVFLFLKKEKAVYIVLAGIMGVLAIFTRYASAIVLFTPAVVAILHTIKKRKIAPLVITIFICIGVAVFFLILKGDNSNGLLNHLQIKGWSVLNFFKDSFTTIDGYSQNRVINLLYALSIFIHPGYFIVGAFFIFFLKRSDFLHPSQKLIFLSVIVYLLFVMGMPFQNMRFLLMVFPLVSIWFFPSFIRAYEWIKTKRNLKYIFLFGVVLANLGMLIYSGRTFIIQNKMEKEIAGALISKYSSTVPLYTFSIDPALKSYGLKNQVYNMWEKEYKEFVPGSLVLFNPRKFAVQWKDMNPMKNWNAMNQKTQLNILERFPDGWELYEIK